MKIFWKVDDGYVNNVEHMTEIPDEDLEGMSPDVRKMEIDEWVSDDFSQNISFEIIREES